jgi:hypothetical protein
MRAAILFGDRGAHATPWWVTANVATAEPLWICEGEKDADAIASHGWLATSAAMGAGSWTDVESAWLVKAGWQGNIVIAIDDDDAGWHHGWQTLKALTFAGGAGAADWLVACARPHGGKDMAEVIGRSDTWWRPVPIATLIERGMALEAKAKRDGALAGSGTWQDKVAAWKDKQLKAAIERGEQW